VCTSNRSEVLVSLVLFACLWRKDRGFRPPTSLTIVRRIQRALVFRPRTLRHCQPILALKSRKSRHINIIGRLSESARHDREPCKVSVYRMWVPGGPHALGQNSTCSRQCWWRYDAQFDLYRSMKDYPAIKESVILLS
jgi:hypothetical protein